MNIGIVGTRRRNGNKDLEKVRRAFLDVVKEFDSTLFKDAVTIISGHCPSGGDRFAELIADEFRLPIILHKPQWNKLGRKAGFARNTLIAQQSDELIACVAADRKGGTEDTIIKFKMYHPGKEPILV